MTVKNKIALDVKGNMYALMSIVLRDADLDEIRSDLAERVRQAPAFFKNTPVIVDFAYITIAADFNFNALFKIVRQHQLLPVAVRGIEEEMREKLQEAGVPIVEQASASSAQAQHSMVVPDVALRDRVQNATGPALIVETPVRSGCRCVAEQGDLVVVSRISRSAELIADGNIHVYGTLRGRASCGVNGDTGARIFCSALEAGLVSVAGRYKVLNEIPQIIKSKPVQIRLQGERLLIEPSGRF